MPLVSVIIPTFNRANFLTKSISSALEQSLQDLEVIVIDDGSTDHTREIVAMFHDPRLAYTYQENQGRGGAINKGISMSKGKYLNKLDSDDWLLPTALEDLVSFIEARPDLGVVAGGFRIVDQDGEHKTDVHPWEQVPDLNLSTWLSGCHLLWQGAVFKREWSETVGGMDRNITIGDDWDFGLRLSAAGCKMEWVKTITCCYRQHAEMSMKSSKKVREDTLYIVEKFFAAPERTNEQTLLKDRVLRDAYLFIAKHEYAHNLISEAGQDLMKAVDIDPSLIDNRGRGLSMVIARWAQSPLLGLNPHQFIHTAYQNLPDNLQYLKHTEAATLAEFAASRLYAAHREKDRPQTLKAFQELFLNNPSRAFDRGIISVLAQSFLGPRLFSAITQLKKENDIGRD